MGADGLVLWRYRRRLHRSAWKPKPYRRNVIGIECGVGDGVPAPVVSRPGTGHQTRKVTR